LQEYSIFIGINEMKQTNPSSTLRVTVSLGILGLNESFVQLNEIMIKKKKRHLPFKTNVFSKIYN